MAAAKKAPKRKPAKKKVAQMSEEKDMPSESEALGNALVSDKSLETVREILFGAQVRENNERSTELEKLINESVSRVEKDMAKQVAAIEKSIAKLRDDMDKRAEKTAAQIASEFEETRQAIASLDAASSTARSDLEDRVTASRDELEKQAKQWNEDLAKQLELVQQQLQHSKTDRSTLSELLHNMADAISDDSNG